MQRNWHYCRAKCWRWGCYSLTPGFDIQHAQMQCYMEGYNVRLFFGGGRVTVETGVTWGHMGSRVYYTSILTSAISLLYARSINCDVTHMMGAHNVTSDSNTSQL
jgi:hypothetical protein